MDVNEEIVEQYLKIVKKWFYMSDIAYKMKHNWGNIDILAFDPVENLYYDIEVKFRSRFKLHLPSFDSNPEKDKFINQLAGEERNVKIQEIIHTTARKIFVTTHSLFGHKEENRREIETRFKNLLKSKGFECEVWYFDDIIRKLVDQTNVKGKYNTQLIQTIRLIKTYIKDESK